MSSLPMWRTRNHLISWNHVWVARYLHINMLLWRSVLRFHDNQYASWWLFQKPSVNKRWQRALLQLWYTLICLHFLINWRTIWQRVWTWLPISRALVVFYHVCKRILSLPMVHISQIEAETCSSVVKNLTLHF